MGIYHIKDTIDTDFLIKYFDFLSFLVFALFGKEEKDRLNVGKTDCRDPLETFPLPLVKSAKNRTPSFSRLISLFFSHSHNISSTNER